VYGVSDKLRRWYWCGVLGELYGGTTESRFARDLEEVVEWAKGGAVPNTIAEATFNPTRLLTLRTRNSAAYKGVYALLMRTGCRDWLYDKSVDLASFFNDRLDIHHIFPKAWCDIPGHGVDSGRRESIVNKTAISYKTNRKIGGRAPSAYLSEIEKAGQVSGAKLDDILRTHAIDPTRLREDDFDGFFEARSTALLALISNAMGKEVLEAVGTPEKPTDFEEEPPEPEDEGSLELIEAAS